VVRHTLDKHSGVSKHAGAGGYREKSVGLVGRLGGSPFSHETVASRQSREPLTRPSSIRPQPHPVLWPWFTHR